VFAPGGRSSGTIHRRIVRTLALPVAVALVLLAVITVLQVNDYRTVAATARAVTLDLAVQDLVQQLQDERGVTAGLLGGNSGFKAELSASRKAVDDQRKKVEKLVDDGGKVEDRVSSALRQLDGLAGVRAATDSGAAARAATFTFFTDRIAALTGVDFGLESSSDSVLRQNVNTLEALSDAKEATAQERAFLNGVFSASGFKGQEFLQFVTMRSAKESSLNSFDRFADSTDKQAKNYVFGTGAAKAAAYFEQVALASGDGRYLQVNPQTWWSSLGTVLDDVLQLQQHVGSVIQDRAQTLQSRATLRMGGLLGAVLLSFVGSVYLATIASRSIARPLVALAGEANRLANERLPEAVRLATSGEEGSPPASVRPPRGASDEVRSVADAFDRVQATAYALATEQAQLRRSTSESLANLGRRNQNLLRRQLGFITRLEREENDPTGLANLFELDHLATRMRRNAESLLVLVGAASPRQWAEPLPVADVIRAAVSEVEEYRRVTLRRVDDAQVVGSVVSGVAHMLAELIENGLSFSPPDVDLEIHGRKINDGYLIAVFDQGVGMNETDLEAANKRLRGEGDFITAPARFLGHYVVGRLAAEMGLQVQLAPSPVTGITARITLPNSVLAGPPQELPAAQPQQPQQQETVRPSLLRRQLLDADQQQWPGPGPLELPAASSAEVPVSPAPPVPAEAAPFEVSSYDTGSFSTGPFQTIPSEEPLRPASPGYAVVAGTASVPMQRVGDPASNGNGHAASPYEAAKAPSSLGMDLYNIEPAMDEGERTVNGLRKRVPKSRRGAASGSRAAATTSASLGDRPEPLIDSPDALRARLSAFRDGVQRGTAESVDRP
jgi:signal transduction histidine kinase